MHIVISDKNVFKNTHFSKKKNKQKKQQQKTHTNKHKFIKLGDAYP